MNTFTAKSLQRLATVHIDLQRLAKEALRVSTIPFQITEGVRTLERQRYLFNAGKSRTMRSRHLGGFAIDVVAMPGGVVSWNFDDYTLIDRAFQVASDNINIPYEWGGTWPRLRDGPHFQLPAGKYPD